MKDIEYIKHMYFVCNRYGSRIDKQLVRLSNRMEYF